MYQTIFLVLKILSVTSCLLHLFSQQPATKLNKMIDSKHALL